MNLKDRESADSEKTDVSTRSNDDTEAVEKLSDSSGNSTSESDGDGENETQEDLETSATAETEEVAEPQKVPPSMGGFLGLGITVVILILAFLVPSILESFTLFPATNTDKELEVYAVPTRESVAVDSKEQSSYTFGIERFDHVWKIEGFVWFNGAKAPDASVFAEVFDIEGSRKNRAGQLHELWSHRRAHRRIETSKQQQRHRKSKQRRAEGRPPHHLNSRHEHRHQRPDVELVGADEP